MHVSSPKQLSKPVSQPLSKGINLHRGLELFHSLFPPLHHIPEQTKSARREGEEKRAVGLAGEKEGTCKGKEREREGRSGLKRIVSEPDTIGGRSGKGIEKELDIQARAAKRRPRRPKINHQSSVSSPALTTQATAITTCSSVEPTSPSLKGLSKKPKAETKITQSLYLKLPQLPFGSHCSYNDIESIRNMIIYPDSPGGPSPKHDSHRIHNKSESLELPGPIESPDYASRALEKHHEYLRKADLVLIRTKPKKMTLPARLFKNIM